MWNVWSVVLKLDLEIIDLLIYFFSLVSCISFIWKRQHSIQNSNPKFNFAVKLLFVNVNLAFQNTPQIFNLVNVGCRSQSLYQTSIFQTHFIEIFIGFLCWMWRGHCCASESFWKHLASFFSFSSKCTLKYQFISS